MHGFTFLKYNTLFALDIVASMPSDVKGVTRLKTLVYVNCTHFQASNMYVHGRHLCLHHVTMLTLIAIMLISPIPPLHFKPVVPKILTIT